MALIHVTIDRSSGAVVIFGTIALLRGLQGCAVGIMYVFVQVSARFILFIDYQPGLVFLNFNGSSTFFDYMLILRVL